MVRRLAIVLGFVCLLSLVAKPLWDAREQWHFGQGYDDGVYMMTAKALATGRGYRAIGLPGEPMQVKYPPLYPLFLSIAWRINPDFPGTLRTAAEMQLLLLPIVAGLMLAVLRQMGLSWRRAFLVAAVNLVTMAVFLVSAVLLSELLFLCLLLGAILALERSVQADSPARWALTAGLLTGLAYLTRGAALPMIAAGPVFLFVRKKVRLSGYFLAAALPVCAGWHWWTFVHANAADPNNVSYVSEFLQRIHATGVGGIFLQQISVLSGGVSQNFLPGFLELLSGIPLHHIFLAASIAGCVRLGRRRQWPAYLIFTGLYLGMLMLWWFEGLTRLLIPVWPMLVAGIAEEASHAAGLCEQAMARWGPVWRRAPRWAFVALAMGIIVHNDRNSWKWLGEIVDSERAMRLEDTQAFSWIARHAGDDTVVLASKDSTINLYTNAAASRSLFLLATEPKSREVATLGPSFGALPGKYRTAMLVLLQSDFIDANWPREWLSRTAGAIEHSRLEYSSPTAMIYTFPIPGRGIAAESAAAR